MNTTKIKCEYTPTIIMGFHSLSHKKEKKKKNINQLGMVVCVKIDCQ